MHVVIFAGGTVNSGRAVAAAIASANLVIAADRGAASALQFGCTPAIVVGDFDSLAGPVLLQLEQAGSEIRRAAVEKDETDTELALQAAIEQGADRITLLGGLGGARFEHTMGNVLLLAAWPDVPIYIIDGPSSAWLVHGPGHTTIDGEIGDLLSLLPLTGEAIGVRTTDLYYPMRGETLPFGRPLGLSNVLTSTRAEVSLEQGMLLLIHTSSRDLKEHEPRCC